MPSGIIIKGIGGFYYVSANDGVYECKARGRFRKDEITPLPGDRVNISVTDGSRRKGAIDEIIPRTSVLTRPAVANVDQVIAVIAVRSPKPDLTLLDKLVVTAEVKGIGAMLCINKVDLDIDGTSGKISKAYSSAGYKVVLSSVKTGEGFNEIKASLTGHITVFAGQSGVGKSTLLNNLLDSEIMETGEISERLKRGRHTTRHAELVKTEAGGYLVDTPGFSSFELTGIEHAKLHNYFPEFDLIPGVCRFSGCSHVNEPDCRIKKALEEGQIDSGRYQRFVAMYSLLKENRNFGQKG